MAQEGRSPIQKLEDEMLEEMAKGYDPLTEKPEGNPLEKAVNFNYGQSRIVVVMSQRTWDIAMGCHVEPDTK